MTRALPSVMLPVARLKTATADVAAAKAAVTAAQINVGYTRVTAPIAGRYERPASPVGNELPGGGIRVAADLGWREVFGDPRLQALIALALRNNRELRIRIDGAREPVHRGRRDMDV